MKVKIDRQNYYVRITTQEIKQPKQGKRPDEIHSTFVSDIQMMKASDSKSVHSGIIKPATDTITSFDTRLAQFIQNTQNVSKVVDENGEPLVVYSGHANLDVYGDQYKNGTAGGFYATENTEIASSYAEGKVGNQEEYVEGSEYLFEYKNGKMGKKIH